MSHTTKGACLSIVLFFSWTAAAVGQNSDIRLLEEIQSAYEEHNYVEVEMKATSALTAYQRFSSDQLAEIHKILGVVYFSLNKPEESEAQFTSALALAPNLSLDPVQVSPKIISFFDQIKQKRMSSPDDGNELQAPRYVLLADKRPGATLRSLVLPGWGQIYKGERKKGFVLSSLWTAGVTATVIAHFSRNSSEDRYLDETDPARLESRFDSFNRLHKLRNGLAAFSAAVWIYSYFDTFLTGKPTAPRKESSAALYPLLAPGSAQLAFRLSFRH